MPYATSNPPVLKSPTPLGGAGNTWGYRAQDVLTIVDDPGYFANGNALGMRVGDLVEVTETGTNAISLHRVTVSTAGGAATVSAGLVIT